MTLRTLIAIIVGSLTGLGIGAAVTRVMEARCENSRAAVELRLAAIARCSQADGCLVVADDVYLAMREARDHAARCEEE